MALTAVNERSTKIITVSFTDEDGAAMTPDTVKWSLRDNYGNVVNSRSSVESVVSSVVTIVLSGADLVFETNSLSVRRLIIEATYTSTNGSGLPLKEEETFSVIDITGV